MGLETGTYIDSLNSANPIGASDPKSEGDDHLRLLKSTIKATFPNLTGAMTATQTDLNLITGQEGVFLNDFFADAGGSVNAMTADFTPNVSLSDGVTVMVKAFGAITLTTPTFAPDGLTAKTIVKGNNEALQLDDIKGSGSTLILQYDGTLDKWILINAGSGGIGDDATGFTKSGTIYIASDGVIATVFDINTNIGGTFEDIGPTSAGATNTWTALDNVNTGATAVLVRIHSTINGATNTDAYKATTYGRKTGSAIATTAATTLVRPQFTNRSGSLEEDSSTVDVWIPVDSTNSFDMAHALVGTTAGSVTTMYLIGYSS